ncbi:MULTISPECIES: Phr family secreted Rap phosphatase inhibitor [unclassified Bacillus (in: firmicutes)]|uniref:Phr family secreted Rap phosphatase inhibitor n=1 Tax=unclassified Bacillus (in: firmicutes) TaxID=185979 RepID=UPI0008DFD642|nr:MULTISPECIES: Phr family secreted Rap phosphatase inhibitor [unclassified Bacillus (in: firmicutes)]SFI36560.1 Phr family secreted Rap phosphatase inhibitor [Bacillus sp. 71mf]SFT24384.1 Phr family secreted Rap phosphatase inhibitor [Bacillus sp. 103mf]SFT24672.1 Phr family secreted Rap phosphatase inhibitor [Bacillus sp. 103mf]
MKKLSLTVMGLAAAGVLSFGASTLSESKQAGHGDFPVSKADVKQYAAHGDTPAPQRPGLTYTHGDHFITKSTYANKGDLPISADGDTGSPFYTEHGDGSGVINNRSHGDSPAPADNRGDGGIISNKSVEDPGGGMVSNESVEDPGGHIVSNESHRDSPAPANNKGDGGVPAYGHGEPWGVADGDTGSHADLPTSADGNHGGSPSYEHGDTPAPQA